MLWQQARNSSSACPTLGSSSPSYSPDLNRIEQAFSKLKALLRKAGECTLQATWRRIGDLLEWSTLAERANS
jgi:transposase